MIKPFFISDGYTESAFLNELPMSHGAIRFTFRPALIEERADIIDKQDRIKDRRQLEQYFAKEIAERIVEWNLTESDKDGNDIPAVVSATNILRLRNHSIFNRLAGIVIYGTEWGDRDPDLSDDAQNEIDQLGLESAISEKPVGEVRQESNEKN